MRILVIEDDEQTGLYLRRGLTESGHVVDWVSDGEDGWAQASQDFYDAIVLDRRLPKLDGLQLVRRLRSQGIGTPVLMLSGVAGTADRVAALREGCDDYLTKPYALSEVVARLEALARRTRRAAAERVIAVGDLLLDTATREVTRAGTVLKLQRREGMILEILMRNRGSIVTRLMIIEAVWPSDFDPRGNIVDMHIHRLRRKLALPGCPDAIRTVPGGGYVLDG